MLLDFLVTKSGDCPWVSATLLLSIHVSKYHLPQKKSIYGYSGRMDKNGFGRSFKSDGPRPTWGDRRSAFQNSIEFKVWPITSDGGPSDERRQTGTVRHKPGLLSQTGTVRPSGKISFLITAYFFCQIFIADGDIFKTSIISVWRPLPMALMRNQTCLHRVIMYIMKACIIVVARTMRVRNIKLAFITQTFVFCFLPEQTSCSSMLLIKYPGVATQ